MLGVAGVCCMFHLHFSASFSSCSRVLQQVFVVCFTFCFLHVSVVVRTCCSRCFQVFQRLHQCLFPACFNSCSGVVAVVFSHLVQQLFVVRFTFSLFHVSVVCSRVLQQVFRCFCSSFCSRCSLYVLSSFFYLLEREIF